MSRLLRTLCGYINPVRLPSLAIWLDAMDKNTLTTSSSRVSQWNDKSGKGNHVSQGTGSLQPLLVSSAINARPAIQFYDDGTAKLLSRADNTTLDYTTFSMFVVCQRVQILAGPERIAGKFSVTTPANQREMSFLFSSSNYFQLSTSPSGTAPDTIPVVPASIGTGVPLILDGRVTQPYAGATALRAVRNNDIAGQITTSITGLFAGTSPFHVGAIDGGSQPFAGYIGEILFYTSALDDIQRARILKYLSNKWGVTLGL